jgi:hypothetical protein
VKQKVALINEIADIFVLATTSKVDQDSLEFISGELKNKFQYVTLKDVDNLSSVIGAFLKSKTRASTLFDGF